MARGVDEKMEKILYLTHTSSDGALSKPALEVLASAVKLSKDLKGSSLTVGLIGTGAEKCADSIANCGAQKYLAVTGADFDVSRYFARTENGN